MRLIHETCRPRPEVLAGELREEEFAARLSRALRPSATAPAVYADPVLFFSRTFPTGGLCTLLRDVLGRLSGKDPSSPAVVRLETGFGGIYRQHPEVLSMEFREDGCGAHHGRSLPGCSGQPWTSSA